MKYMTAALLSVLIATSANAQGFQIIPGFNGGKMQANFNFQSCQAGGGGEYVFLNNFKTAKGWTYGDNSAIAAPNTLDSGGYPTNNADLLAHNGVTGNFCTPSQTARPGNSVVLWSGNGTMQAIAAVTASTQCPGTTTGVGSPTSTTGSGRWVVTPTSGQVNSTTLAWAVGPLTIGTPNITNIAVVHCADEAQYLANVAAGQTWGGLGPQFLSLANKGVVGSWRDLNLGNINFSNWAFWSQRTPINYYSYTADQYRPELYLGATTNVGDDYSITCPSGSSCFGAAALTDKMTIQLRFNVNATAIGCNTSASSSCGTGGLTICSGTVAVPLTACGGASFTSTPAIVVHWPSHGFSGNEPIGFGASGLALPAPVFAAGAYYVGTVLDANDFTISTVPSGSAVVATASRAAVSGQAGVRSPTFSLNGIGAVQIRDAFGQGFINTPNGNICALFVCGSTGTAFVYATLQYDATFGTWISFGAGNGSRGSGLTYGVPPEVELAIATQTGTHPYFVARYMTVDPMTDYIPSFAAYLNANKPAWMVPRQEVTNETWNTIDNATQWGYQREFYHWGTYTNNTNSAPNDWVGLIGSTIGQAFNAAFGGIPNDGTQYQILVGAQNATFSSTANANTNDNRLTSPLYVGGTGVGLPQAGYTATAASGWVNRAVTSQYFAPSANAGALETLLATQYAAAAGNPTLQSTLAQQYVGTATGSAAGGVPIGVLATRYAFFSTWAAKFTNSAGKTITPAGYEGGYSVNYGIQYAFSAPIVSATLATQGVFTLGQDANGYYYGAVPGQTFSVAGVVASGWTGLNGNKYVVQSVSGSGPYQVALNVDTSGFGAACASGCGTATYTNPTYSVTGSTSNGTQAVLSVSATAGLYPGYNASISGVTGLTNGFYTVQAVGTGSITINTTQTVTGSSGSVIAPAMPVLVDTLRFAGKSAPNLQTIYLANINNWKSVGGEFPSEFQFGGTVGPENSIGQITSSGPQISAYNFPSNNTWSVWEDIYAAFVPMQWLAMCRFSGVSC